MDNASTDGTAQALAAEFPDVVILEQAENLGFARAANAGAATANGERLLFLNSDCILRAGALERLEAVLDEHLDAAGAVPRLVSPGGSVEHNVARLPTPRSIAAQYLLGRMSDPYTVAELDVPTPVESCSGAALLISREDFRAAGGFHEDYFMYVEDVELCRRLAENGRSLYYVPDSVIVARRRREQPPESGRSGRAARAKPRGLRPTHDGPPASGRNARVDAAGTTDSARSQSRCCESCVPARRSNRTS